MRESSRETPLDGTEKMPAYTTVYRYNIEHHPKEEEAAVYWVRKRREKNVIGLLVKRGQKL